MWIENGKYVGLVDDFWIWCGEVMNGYVGLLYL